MAVVFIVQTFRPIIELGGAKPISSEFMSNPHLKTQANFIHLTPTFHLTYRPVPKKTLIKKTLFRKKRKKSFENIPYHIA